MEGDPRHEDCWAKTTEDGQPGINVRDHCLNVGCVAEALLSGPLLGAATLAALHDVGKVSPGFARKCEAWLILHALRDRALNESWHMREGDHAKVSQFTVQGLLGKSKLFQWAAALGAHHGRIKGERLSLREPWEAERRRLADELISEFGPLPDHPPDENEATLWFVAGLITVADWIGSDERHFPQEARWDMTRRRERALSALGAIGWNRATARRGCGFAELFPEIAQANGLQTAALQLVREPGVYIIEGPMGCGKTEAALAGAYQLITAQKATGLYFALPTQVTSNRIHLRVRPFIERISDERADVRLAHGASWLVQNDPPPKLRPANTDDEAHEHVRAGRSWFASPKRALLTPYGVGTIDQALLGVVAAKHFFVRQFGLAGKVVVLDEVHTYDLYTSTLIDALVRRLRDLDCTVLILSATLTKARRRQLLGVDQGEPLSDAYPLLSVGGGPCVEVACEPPPPKTVVVRFPDRGVLVDETLERAGDGQCVLWIRNTVDDAQETYRSLKAASREGGPEIGLLHARFPFFRREQLESDWMERLGKQSPNRPEGCVLVSTQVAEQSVDIDADLLITDLAPTDMLLQRIGRLWRHGRFRPAGWRPEVWVRSFPLNDEQLGTATAKELKTALGKTAKIYAPYVLIRSLVQWRGRETIELPSDLRAILEATYAEPDTAEPASWRELRDDLESQKRKLADWAVSATNVWTQPALPDEEDIQTRHSSYPSAGLLLVRGVETLDSQTVRLNLLDGIRVEAGTHNWSFDAARAMHRNLVRLPRWAVSVALLKPPGWLTNQVPQPTAVGLIRPDGDIRWLGSEIETGLSYHADQGLIIKRGSGRAHRGRNSMNLTTEPWIPAIWRDGRPVTVTLCEAFARGHEVQDLAVRPHERIALMRLLICIAQSALDGPADFDDWQSSQPRIAPAAVDYLERWKNAFELFGIGPRFLQVIKLRKPPKKKSTNESEGEDEGTSTSKLDLSLATGNNTTLFDNAGGSERAFTFGELALMFLTFQCFSPGGRIGVAEWNGAPTPGGGSSDHAPCVAGGMLHALLRGDTLLDSIQRNLITKRQAERFFGRNSWGKPVWEKMPDEPSDAAAGQNANRSYLGRLVPLTRAVWLAGNGRSLLLANGLEYAPYPSWREPSATIITREIKGKPERQLVRASVEKAAWRELHALTVKAVGPASNGGPAALDNVSDDGAFDLWVGGLVASKAKLVDIAESVFHVPAAMLGEPSQTAYEKGVREAERTSFRIMRAVSTYHRELGDSWTGPK